MVAEIDEKSLKTAIHDLYIEGIVLSDEEIAMAKQYLLGNLSAQNVADKIHSKNSQENLEDF